MDMAEHDGGNGGIDRLDQRLPRIHGTQGDTRDDMRAGASQAVAERLLCLVTPRPSSQRHTAPIDCSTQ